MKKVIVLIGYYLVITLFTCCETKNGREIPRTNNTQKYEVNISRSIKLADNAMASYFSGDSMVMSRYYNPYTQLSSDEKGSIWMYNSAIEAVNAILHSITTEKEKGNRSYYDRYYNKYIQLLSDLYSNAGYYLGTFTLTSYTQTAEWTVYGVNRGIEKGRAKVEGIENVYDDQMWLIRELIESYRLTGNEDFLSEVEYLTTYVLDGWDCTMDEDGNERGGITWGPGYVSKHACSNAPMISPLVWLHEIYKNKSDLITYRFIDSVDKKTRKSEEIKKSEYYLFFAEKIYDWQKQHLLRSDGVYDDMMGGCSPNKPEVENIYGEKYREGIICIDRVGPAITYNSGTMLSGAADLYRVTDDNIYYTDGVNLSDASFKYFANLGDELDGYYTYDVSGFRNWFNLVLLRGFIDFYPFYKNTGNYIQTFQQNLDYGYKNFLYEGFLPDNLLKGWKENIHENNLEGMSQFAYITEYALLSKFELEK